MAPALFLAPVGRHLHVPFTWSDGTPASVADMELGYKIDCDKTSGAVSYITCDAMQGVEFGSPTASRPPATSLTVSSTHHLSPIGVDPSHQVVSDGRNLADVPAGQ